MQLNYDNNDCKYFLRDSCVLGTLYEFSYLIFTRTLWGRYFYYINFTKKTKTRDGTLILLTFQSKVMHLHLKNRLRSVSGHVVNWMCRETLSGIEHLKCWQLEITSFPKHDWASREVRKLWLERRTDRVIPQMQKLCDLGYGF